MFLKRGILNIALAAGLLLGIHNGYIALWQSGSDHLCRVFPYKASLLPQAEQEQLAEGITIRDDEHLKELLRDYLS